MISYDAARRALDERLEAFQSDDVQWENTQYTPVEGTGYLRSFLLPAEPFQASTGATGLDYNSGIYQIDVAEPKDVGAGAIQRKIDLVIAQFARGLNVTADGVTLTILRSWPGPAFTRDSFYIIPISVSWYSYE